MMRLEQTLVEATRGEHPLASAAVAIVSVDGHPVVSAAVGTTRWVSDLASPAVAVTLNTRFDFASVSKLFTAAALLVCLDERGLRDDTRVADVLPEFENGAARTVTCADLLRHTSGLSADWGDRSRDADAWRRFRTTRPDSTPGSRYRYSCVGYIWAGLVAEALTGEQLDRLIGRTLLSPLGLEHSGFAPPPDLRHSIAATELQTVPDRGIIQGEVHDESAWVLGGIVGNAGMFGTAGDLLRFVEILRTNGMHDGHRILPEWVVTAMITDRLPADVRDRPTYGQALGPRMSDPAWMGALAAHGAIGHTGFTGTSALTSPGGAHSVILLTNRVHPTRYGTDPTALRRWIADHTAHL